MFLFQVTFRKCWKLEIGKSLSNWLSKNPGLFFLRILTRKPGTAPKFGPGWGSTLSMGNGYNKCCLRVIGSRLLPSKLSNV